jgi:hypothetical protein
VARLSPAQVVARLYALADELEPRMAVAFRTAVADLVARAEVGPVARALARGDIATALDALHIDAAAFGGLTTVMQEAFEGGGRAAQEGLPRLSDPAGAAVVVRFDVRNPRAEGWLRTQSSRLITAITEDVRTAARATLVAGLEDGRNPNNVALDIVGRLNPATKRREGGILGLTSVQEAYVRNARAELLSGDPATMARYFERKRRDKRFDRAVSAAVRAGKPVDAATVAKIAGRYADRLLELRGQTIARTEMLASLNAGALEGMEQAIDTGAIRRQQVVKVWRTASDARVRETHRAMSGQRRQLDEVFSNGLRFPHEPGAPASQVANCRCVIYHDVFFLAGALG